MTSQEKAIFPSFQEIKKFIQENDNRATICQIRDHFGQMGSSTVHFKDKVLAYKINQQFYNHLHEFIKQFYVECDFDYMMCLAYDRTIYTGSKQFVPLVLSIKS